MMVWQEIAWDVTGKQWESVLTVAVMWLSCGERCGCSGDDDECGCYVMWLGGIEDV